MCEVNKELRDYIEQKILPIYEKNDSGHGIDHIKYVTKRSLSFACQFLWQSLKNCTFFM